MARGPLSKTMASALYEIAHAGSVVERKPGGYWVLPHAKMLSHGSWNPAAWGTSTIEALVGRGKMIYTAHQEGRNGSFPIRAEVVPV